MPLLFVHSTGVGLELPTEEQRHDAVRSRSGLLPSLALPALHGTEARWLRAQETHGVVPTHERVALALEPGAATRVHTNVQFKRNKAKGPNPLAVKKKIAKPAAQGAQARARMPWRAGGRGHQCFCDRCARPPGG